MNQKTKILIILLAVIVVFLGWGKWTLMKKTKSDEAVPPPSSPKVEITPAEEQSSYPTTIGNFLVTNKEICQENGKPIIYYFGSKSCPHCLWEEPIVKRVAEKFSGLISFRNNMDKEADTEIFSQYSDINPGYIPFLVFGCKYARLGSGESEGEAKEEENLTALICKLTDLKPEKVCQPLRDKIAL